MKVAVSSVEDLQLWPVQGVAQGSFDLVLSARIEDTDEIVEARFGHDVEFVEIGGRRPGQTFRRPQEDFLRNTADGCRDLRDDDFVQVLECRVRDRRRTGRRPIG